MAFLELKPLLEQAAKRYGYDPALLAGQAWQESQFNPKARSRAGAVGLMQFMPDTWADWGRGADPDDPAASADAGVRYMRYLMARYASTAEPVSVALAAYNWGMGNVDKAMQKSGRSDWQGLAPFLPEETRAYVPLILTRAAFYKAAFITGIAGPAVALLGFLAFLLVRRVMA